MAELTTTLSGYGAAQQKEASQDVVATRELEKESAKLTEATFDVTGLDLFYDQTQALKDISMKINKNEITAFIGPSGCGKSTFLKTLNRMNDWVEGCRITGKDLFEGKDIFKEVDPLALRYRVGMVFQQPTPFPKSVFENVAYGPRIQGISNKKELEEIVEKSLRAAACWDEMKDRLHKSALGLSGGQQQRLCLARTLAANPSDILMDEPPSALDPIGIEGKIYHRHRNAQHAAGPSYFRQDGLLPPGRVDRIQQHGRHVYQSVESENRRIHHGPLRLIGG